MKDPIIIDPPDFDQEKAWSECREWVDRHRGLTYPDGEGNYMAAAGADPGCVSCPACREYHWAWGRRQRCTACGFEYEADWWCMFSWGVQYSDRHGKLPRRFSERMKEKYGGHPYFEYGWNHPELLDRGDLFKTAHELDWRSIMGATTIAPGDAGDEDGGGR